MIAHCFSLLIEYNYCFDNGIKIIQLFLLQWCKISWNWIFFTKKILVEVIRCQKVLNVQNFKPLQSQGYVKSGFSENEILFVQTVSVIGSWLQLHHGIGFLHYDIVIMWRHLSFGETINDIKKRKKKNKENKLSKKLKEHNRNLNLWKSLKKVIDEAWKQWNNQVPTEAATKLVCEKKCSLKFRKIHRKTLVPESLFHKRDLTHVFSCEFCEIFKNTFFTELLRTIVSVPILAFHEGNII